MSSSSSWQESSKSTDGKRDQSDAVKKALAARDSMGLGKDKERERVKDRDRDRDRDRERDRNRNRGRR